MDFLQLAKTRYSVRKFKDTPVEQDKLNAILEAGRICPTAANRQPNHFLVLNDAAGMEKLGKSCRHFNPPLAIVVCADKSTVWVRKYDNWTALDVDATIATDHMMLQAQALGLSSCWIAHFDPAVVREEFNLPDNLIPINILVIGYANEEPQSPDRHSTMRKPIDEMVHYGSF